MDVVWILAPIAALMAAIIARLVKWSSEVETRLAAAVDVFLLEMMAAMFLGLYLYYTAPGVTGFVLGLWVAVGLMSASVFPLFVFFFRELTARARRGTEYRAVRLRGAAGLSAWVVGFVFAGEFLMGRSFGIASGGFPTGAPGDLSAWGTFLVTSITSPWFLLPMALEMGLTTLWLWPRLPPRLKALLASQAVSMVLVPPAFSSAAWGYLSSVGAGVLMTAVYVYLARQLLARERLSPTLAGYAEWVLVAFAVMPLGLLLWILDGSAVLFAFAVVVQMAVFFSSVVGLRRFEGENPRSPAAEAAVLPIAPATK